jgi:hypothetical protein
MKKQFNFLILVIIAFLFNYHLISQTDSTTLSLTKKYFSGDFKNYKSYLLTESIDQEFDPRKIPKKAIISYENILTNQNQSVIAVSVDEKDNHSDLYVLWINKNGWKLKSIRTLWLPAMFKIVYSQFKDLDEAGIKLKYNEILKKNTENDSTLNESEAINQTGNFEDFKANINCMKQTCLPDKDLMTFFNANSHKFNSLLQKVLQDNADINKTYLFDYKSPYKSLMQEIIISSVSNVDNPKIIRFVVGGMGNNLVGYFYCQNPEDLPNMDTKGFILIRTLGNGWYLFKTT